MARKSAVFLLQVCGTPTSFSSPPTIGVRGGDKSNLESIMFTYRFIAVRRSDTSNKLHSLSAVATSERDARCQFAKEFILFFAARLPVIGGAA